MNALRPAAAGLAAGCAAPAASPPDARRSTRLTKLVKTHRRPAAQLGRLQGRSCYLEQKEKDKTDIVCEALVYRRERGREADDPLHQAEERGGQGLPAPRQEPLDATTPPPASGSAAPSASASAAPTPAARDFDESRLAEEYDPTFGRRREAGRASTPGCSTQGEGRGGRGLPAAAALDRRGDRQRAQAAGVRALRAADADALLSEVEEALQRVEGRRRVVPGGDPHLRRGGEGQLDHHPASSRWTCARSSANIFTKAWLESKSR